MAIVAAGLTTAACESPPASSASWDYRDAEYQLALLDDAPLTDAAIGRYAGALDVAGDACRQDRRALGDIAVATRRLVADAGMNISVLQVLQAIPGAVPPAVRPFDCTDLPAILSAAMTGAPPTTSVVIPTTTTTIAVEQFAGQTLDGERHVIRSDDGTTFVRGVPKDIDDIDQMAAAGDCDGLRDRARAWARLAGLGDEGKAASVYAQHAVNTFEWIRCRGDALERD